MDLTKLNVPLSALTKDKPVVVTSVSEVHEFKDGRSTDEIVAYRVEVVATGNSFEKFTVKVTEKPMITEEQLGKAVVSFVDFEGKIYRDFKNNRYDISCKARAVNVVKN